MQAISADSVIAYITHDDRLNIPSAVKPACSEAEGPLERAMSVELKSCKLLRRCCRPRKIQKGGEKAS